MPVYSIPSSRLPASGTWEAAGIPGGIPTRTTIYTTITATGSDQTSEINTALADCPNGQVVLLAAGTFRCDGSPTIPVFKQVTLRGVRDSNGDWLTKLDCRNGGVRIGGQYAFDWPPAGAVVDVSSLTKGSTTIQVDDASYFGAGQLCKLWCDSDPTFPELHVYGNTPTRGQTVRIVSVDTGADTITIESPGLHGDFTTAPSARLFTNQGLQNYNAGVEDLWLTGENSSALTTVGIVMDSSYACWIKTCKVDTINNYGICIGNSYGGNYRCEVRECWSEGENTNATSHAGIFVGNGSTSTLITECVINAWIFALLQQSLTSGTVFAYNLWLNTNSSPVGYRTNIDSNHDPTPSFTLFEGNVGSFWNSDGYFGGSLFDMQFRNWWMGNSLNTSDWFLGLIACRNTLYLNSLGNVIGRTGINIVYTASYGNPNIGNGSSSVPGHSYYMALSELTTRTDATSGTITAPVGHGVTTAATIDIVWSEESIEGYNIPYCRRGVTVGTVSGQSIPFSGGAGDDLPALNADIFVPTDNTALRNNWLDWDAALEEPKSWAGTLSTRTSDTAGVVTLDGGLAADFTTCWNAAFSGDGTPGHGQRGISWSGGGASVVVTDVTGNDVTFYSSSSTLPAASTPITFVPSNFGFQELDMDVLYLALLKGNYYGKVTGSGIPTVESLGGDTLQDSLFLSSEPQSFTDAGLTWPPIDSSSPVENTYELVPAGVAFNLGYFPTGSSNTVSTGISGLAKISGKVTIQQ